MLGDSKIVLLDEPTSGMDPTARRRLWELLKDNKDDKIIILTTHYMEEADILGDRIAIMADGNAQCCGSSIFLKEKFGVGYYLTIDKTTQNPAPEIDKFVMQRIAGAIKLSEVSSEISFQLPNVEVESFRDFFLEIDQNMEALQIKSYGISATTLEEVFLKVGDGLVEKEDEQETSLKVSEEEKNNDAYCLVDESVQGIGLTFLQLKAMIKIRFLMSLRELRILFLEIFLPTLLIAFAAIMLGVTNINSYSMSFLDLEYVPESQITTFGFDSANVDTTIATAFMNTYYAAEPFNGQIGTKTFTNLDIFTAADQFDEYVVNEREQGTSIFSVYIRNIKDEDGLVNIEVLTLVDPAQNGGSGYAIQGAMTSVLRYATGDNSAEFNLGRGPFPMTKKDDSIVKLVFAIITVFCYSVALGIITSSMAGNI